MKDDGDFNRELGQRLREAREYLGFTQAQVADHLEVFRESVTEMEAGRRRVQPWELAALARLYGRSADVLLGLVDPVVAVAGLSSRTRDLVDSLSPQDQAEVVRFGEFLAERKRLRGGR